MSSALRFVLPLPIVADLVSGTSLLRCLRLPLLTFFSGLQCDRGLDCPEVQNAGDASAIVTCSAYSGSIAVATGTTDNLPFVDNLKNIAGNPFVESNSDLKRLSASSLTCITDELRFNDVW